MSKIILLPFVLLFCACAALPGRTPTPEPTKPASSTCKPPSEWTIEYHRTGGIGGFDQSLTLQSDGSLSIQSKKPALDKQFTIPEDHLAPIKNLLVQACPFGTGRAEGVCADCYTYEMKIKMDGQTYDAQATDTTLTEDLRPLINTLDQFLQLTGQ